MKFYRQHDLFLPSLSILLLFCLVCFFLFRIHIFAGVVAMLWVVHKQSLGKDLRRVVLGRLSGFLSRRESLRIAHIWHRLALYASWGFR